jgi:hypothetical protein
MDRFGPVVPLTVMPCRIRTPHRPKGYQRICPQPGSSFLALLLAPPRCYGSQVTRESWPTKTLRKPGLRIKVQFFPWTELRFSGTIVPRAMA